MDIKRKKYFIILLLILFFITISFAVLSSYININGQTTFSRNDWNVKFQNIVFDSNSTATGSQSISDNTTLNCSVEFDKPGDFYAFTVDVVNTGSIDAMISSFNKSSLTEYEEKLISFNVVYSDGTYIDTYDKLNKTDGVEKILVLVQYKESVDSSDLPTSTFNLNLNFTINYVEADENARLKDSKFIYSYITEYPGRSSSDSVHYYGNAYPSDLALYTSSNDIFNVDPETYFFQRYYMKNDLIEYGSLGILYNSKIYYFTFDFSDSSYYISKYLIKKIYSSSECNFNYDSKKISCDRSDFGKFYFSAVKLNFDCSDYYPSSMNNNCYFLNRDSQTEGYCFYLTPLPVITW